jgi:hypothetical protein
LNDSIREVFIAIGNGEEWLPELALVEVEVQETWIVELLNIGPNIVFANHTSNALELADGIIHFLVHFEAGGDRDAAQYLLD